VVRPPAFRLGREIRQSYPLDRYINLSDRG
jgi:hypothetical protein